MEPLILKETEDTPEIIFNPEENIFKISKISVPEDAFQFYEPILTWLKNYEKNPNPETIVNFDLEYVNTASSKQLIQIMLLLEKIAEKSKVTIKWYYEAIDEDMQSLGERYNKLVKVNFEFIEI